MIDKREKSYAQFLEENLEEIGKTLALLLWAREQGQSVAEMKKLFDEIEEWLGDDWWLDLPEEQQDPYLRYHGALDDELSEQD